MFEFNGLYKGWRRKCNTKVIRSNQLFAASEVKSFEIEYADISWIMHLALAMQHRVASGAAALGIGQGDEVIVTAFSWISTASCILMQNAVPIFCDIEENSFGMDPTA